MEEKVKVFKALSDVNRLRILKILQEKSLCVCEIKEVLKLANSTVSQHLSILKEVGFIVESKDGKWVNYKINSNPSNPMVASIIAMLIYWLKDEPIIAKDLEIINSVDRNIICSK